MSSSYRRICLNHTPPLVIDKWGESHPPQGDLTPEGHEGCKIAVGRYSTPIIEVWLSGTWYDVAWIRQYPEVARAILDGLL